VLDPPIASTPIPTPDGGSVIVDPSGFTGGVSSVDTTRWNVSTVFQENFSNLANKGEFLGKYSKWSAYPTNYLVTDKQGYYDPGQISVKDITVDGTIRRVSPVSSSSPRRHPRCLVPPVMATAGNGQIGFKTGTSTAGFLLCVTANTSTPGRVGALAIRVVR
jgi:hypothetical protein